VLAWNKVRSFQGSELGIDRALFHVLVDSSKSVEKRTEHELDASVQESAQIAVAFFLTEVIRNANQQSSKTIEEIVPMPRDVLHHRPERLFELFDPGTIFFLAVPGVADRNEELQKRCHTDRENRDRDDDGNHLGHVEVAPGHEDPVAQAFARSDHLAHYNEDPTRAEVDDHGFHELGHELRQEDLPYNLEGIRAERHGLYGLLVGQFDRSLFQVSRHEQERTDDDHHDLGHLVDTKNPEDYRHERDGRDNRQEHDKGQEEPTKDSEGPHEKSEEQRQR